MSALENRHRIEQLRADIDKGRTGDKVSMIDPAAAPLGADDEAAGTPPSSERVSISLRNQPRLGGKTASQEESRRPHWAFWAGAVLALVVVGAALIMMRA